MVTIQLKDDDCTLMYRAINQCLGIGSILQIPKKDEKRLRELQEMFISRLQEGDTITGALHPGPGAPGA